MHLAAAVRFAALAGAALATAALGAGDAPATPPGGTPAAAPGGTDATRAAGGPAVAGDLGRSLDAIVAAKGRMDENERLRSLLDAAWDDEVRQEPELATFAGLPADNDRWPDLSEEAIGRRHALLPRVLAAVESIDRSALGEAERTDYDLFRRQAQLDLEGSRFPQELLALDQLSGVHQSVPLTIESMPAGNLAQYQDILARLRGVPRLVEQTIALLTAGLAAGVTPPRVALREVPAQVAALAAADPLASPMLAAFGKFPDGIPAQERERLRRQAVEAFSGQVAPAFRRLHDFLEITYVPGARQSIAMSALPDGEAWYAWNVRGATTTDLSPRQIHEIGQAETRRIRRQMDGLIATIGWKGSFAELQRFLRSDRRFFFDRPEDLVVAYRDLCKRIDPQLIKLFHRLPRLPYGVLPMAAYEEQSAPAGYYYPGSAVAGRPGYFYVNTFALDSRPRWAMEALALHEAVPGHHLQMSLAQEREGVSQWRRYQVYPAFSEGWALYAESLGTEIGMYQDPYSKLGQLTNEALRAVRLVADTGMHAMGWTRQQAIAYATENTAKPEREIAQEIDRYIVHPGGVLAYKIGALKIVELRAYAEKELGETFDLRDFHDQLLARGSLPLDVLETGIKEWVARRLPARLSPPARWSCR